MTKRHPESGAKAKTLRADLTAPVRALWNVLRASRLEVKFQRQVVLPPYVADFAARSERLVIELDGVSRSILIALGHDPNTPLSPTLSP